jgi:hypothetical protein
VNIVSRQTLGTNQPADISSTQSNQASTRLYSRIMHMRRDGHSRHYKYSRHRHGHGCVVHLYAAVHSRKMQEWRTLR